MKHTLVAGELAWADNVLRSHDPSVVEDLSASLELAPSTTAGDDEPLLSSRFFIGQGEEVLEVPAGDSREAVAGNGAVLVHGPPGVGKTLLVRETAAPLLAFLLSLCSLASLLCVFWRINSAPVLWFIRRRKGSYYY